MGFQSTQFLALMVYQFWLSGLFVLSVIFLDIDDLDTLTLCTFAGYAVGSFIAGISSDIVGRRPLFVIFSVLLFFAAVTAFFNVWVGLILANICIGPLNNLTFVFLTENQQLCKESNFVKVILGWVASEITLGLFFLLLDNQEVFLMLLTPLTGLFTMASLVLTKETETFAANKDDLRSRTCLQMVVPKELKALLGGSILMFMMQMFYYRTQFTLDQFGISLEVNTIIVGVTEGIANITLSGFIRRRKRKRSLMVLMTALMSLLLCLMLIETVEIQSVVEGMMRFCDSCIMLILGFYLPQLFSVGERGKGINYVMSVGVFGSALSGKIFTHLPFAYLQIFLFVAFLGLMLLPETLKERQRQERDHINESLVQ